MYAFQYHPDFRNDEDLDHDPAFKTIVDGFVSRAKTILDIGWRLDTYSLDFPSQIAKQGTKMTIVDAFEPNVNDLRSRNPDPNFIFPVLADIRKFIKETNQTWDVGIWQNGPEHVLLEEFSDFLVEADKKIEVMIIATPNGVWPQGALGGNIYEVHISTWTQETFSKFGFTSILWQPATRGSRDRTLGIIGYRVNPTKVA